MAKMKIVWDEKALERAMNDSPATMKAVQGYVSKKVANANAMASGYVTKGFYQNHQLVDGKKQAKYDGNVKRKGNGWIVGLVFTANQSAAKENLEHNTLMKA